MKQNVNKTGSHYKPRNYKPPHLTRIFALGSAEDRLLVISILGYLALFWKRSLFAVSLLQHQLPFKDIPQHLRVFLHQSHQNMTDPIIESATDRLSDLSIAEKSGNISDEVPDPDLDGDTSQQSLDASELHNEFLNSSSFLSNSQIIRSTNVASFKPSSPSLMSSPVRRPLEQATPESSSERSSSTQQTKPHFKLLQTKRSTRQLRSSNGSPNKDNEGELEGDDLDPDSTNSDDHKSTKFIDIDDPKATPKLPKMHPDSTPWRRLRPQSTIRVKSTEPNTLPKPDVSSIHYVQSLFDANFESGSTISSTKSSGMRSGSLFEPSSSGSEGATANTSYELENLRKQVTNYKLHQRVLMELIRNLVATSGMNNEDIKRNIMDKLEKENEFLISERQTLQDELSNTKKNSKAAEKDEERYNGKVKEILDLKNDLITAKSQCTELTSYVDELRAQLATHEKTTGGHVADSQRWDELLNSILSILLGLVKGESARAVQQARDSSKSIDTKLNVIKLALGEVSDAFEKTQKKVLQENRNNENVMPGELAKFKGQFQEKLNQSKQVEQELRSLLRQQEDLVSTLRSEHTLFQKQFQDNFQVTKNLKQMLADKRAQISHLNDKILELEAHHEELEDSRGSEYQEKEAKLLKSRLSIMKVNHSKDVERLHAEIDNLQTQLEEKSRRQDDKKLMDDLTRKQTYINELNDEIAALNSRLLSSNRDHEAELVKVKSLLQDSRDDFEGLVREYNTLQLELKELQQEKAGKERDYRRKLEHAAKELNLAVTKQRTLGAEKSKLTYAFEESKREKHGLKMSNMSLNEKISRLTYEVSALANYEVGFKSLFELQVHHIQNMLQDFEPLLEKSSYEQAQHKLDKLSDPSLDIEKTHATVRSLLAFFENATGSLIDDHTDLMKNAGQQDYEEMRARLAELEDQLQRDRENVGNSHDNEDGDSPRTKLRIEDLQRKFKAERERRRVEYDQSQKVVSSLERENRELKEELERLRHAASR